MARNRAYQILCGVLGLVWMVGGLFLFALFFGYHLPGSDLAIPTGPIGFYFVAFTGCALVAWGGSLMTAALHPYEARGVGTVTAFALVLSAIYRMAAWTAGDYYVWPGELLRSEVVVFLVLALAFVWLRPARVQAVA